VTVASIAAARQRKLEAESIGYFDESTPDIEQVQRTCDKKRRVAIMNPPNGNAGWSMSPDEADRFADALKAAAAEARE
jgi:predicted RNA methylase